MDQFGLLTHGNERKPVFRPIPTALHASTMPTSDIKRHQILIFRFYSASASRGSHHNTIQTSSVASIPRIHQPEFSLLGTLASPRTGLAPSAFRELHARLCNDRSCVLIASPNFWTHVDGMGAKNAVTPETCFRRGPGINAYQASG